MGDMIQGMLETELDDELGYSKYDYNQKHTDNSCKEWITFLTL